MGPRRKYNKAFVSETLHPAAVSSSRDCQTNIAFRRILTTPPSFCSAQRDSL
jgi:hypothetical protein